ncbi:tetratricopeptide repeat protein [Halanaerobium saccharolyticum]|uniref:peptidylprolyl isomerase n=1 Tax=Halanaerobium saccharolyticum TaxID=43595 RepID=A0A4V3CE61_9FIRM|nr:SurA N-terminal domain-containing protein [Halanaerobium saccharolyticum]TDO84448.1 tetratricopeptide repeat protein [Halanaerobium saccharolyticum]
MFDTLRDNSKIIVYIVVIIFVISGGFMGFGAYLNRQSGGGGQASNQTPAVIAEVNGMEISQQEYYSLLQQQAPQSNLSSSQIIPFRYNVLNALIERKLIMAQAETLDINVEVSKSEIDENYKNILDQNKMTEEELTAALSKQGYTLGELRSDIKSNLKESKTITKTIDKSVGEIKVSEQEIKDLYNKKYPEPESETKAAENNTDSESSQRPALSDVRSDLKSEIKNKKRNEAINKWLKDLKASAEITINNPVLSAYHALQNENYTTAVEKFSELVKQEETDPIFYTYLARSYKQQDKFDQAKEVYENAIKAFPENNNLRINYAQFLADQNNNEAAITQLDKVAAAAKDDFMTHYQLYMMYSRLGAEEKAKAEMEEIQRLSKQMQSKNVPSVPGENDEENTNNTDVKDAAEESNNKIEESSQGNSK